MRLSNPRLPQLSRRSALLAPSSFRVQVRPPSLRHAPESGWQKLLFWLLAPAPQDAAPPLNRLPAIRADFLATLADLGAQEAGALRSRIQAAYSLRELWHLRADVFSTLSLALSQSQAENRVQGLNHHFPTQAPRTQASPS